MPAKVQKELLNNAILNEMPTFAQDRGSVGVKETVMYFTIHYIVKFQHCLKQLARNL